MKKTLESLQGKKTYATIGAAFAYLLAAKYGLIEGNTDVIQIFELAALAFVRSAIGTPTPQTPPVTPNQ